MTSCWFWLFVWLCAQDLHKLVVEVVVELSYLQLYMSYMRLSVLLAGHDLARSRVMHPPAGTLAHLSGCHPFTENGLASKGVHLPLPLTPCTPGQLSVRLDAIPTNGVLKRLVHFKGVRLDPSKSYSYSSTHRFVWMMPLKNLSDVSIVCLTSAWAKTSAAVKVYPGVFGLPSFGNAWCWALTWHAAESCTPPSRHISPFVRLSSIH